MKMKVTTIDYIFDMTTSTLCSKFVQDPNIVNKNNDLIKTLMVNDYHSILPGEKLNMC